MEFFKKLFKPKKIVLEYRKIKKPKKNELLVFNFKNHFSKEQLQWFAKGMKTAMDDKSKFIIVSGTFPEIIQINKTKIKVTECLE